jgi:hypothetical protein
MSLDEDYPKTHRDLSARLGALLRDVPGLPPEELETIVDAINNLADKACDLEDIVQRLLKEQHTPAEVGELLIAIELTTEQIRGSSEDIDGKLYEIGDKLKEMSPTRPA